MEAGDPKVVPRRHIDTAHVSIDWKVGEAVQLRIDTGSCSTQYQSAAAEEHAISIFDFDPLPPQKKNVFKKRKERKGKERKKKKKENRASIYKTIEQSEPCANMMSAYLLQSVSSEIGLRHYYLTAILLLLLLRWRQRRRQMCNCCRLYNLAS